MIAGLFRSYDSFASEQLHHSFFRFSQTYSMSLKSWAIALKNVCAEEIGLSNSDLTFFFFNIDSAPVRCLGSNIMHAGLHNVTRLKCDSMQVKFISRCTACRD